MRAVLQRVLSAEVTVDGRRVGAIGAGLLVLLGVETGDGPADVAYTARRSRDLRCFADEAGRMNRSVAEVGGGVLVVSQFTLCGDTRKGRRPSFDGGRAARTRRGCSTRTSCAICAHGGLPSRPASFRP